MIAKNILFSFLEENKINVSELKSLNQKISEVYLIFNYKKNQNSDTNLVYKIIAEFYDLHNNSIKKIIKIYEKKTSQKLGRNEKNIIRDILIYDEDNHEKLFDNYSLIKDLIKENKEDKTIEAKLVFLENFKNANIKRKEEYLFSLFLRLFHKIELSHINLIDIFNFNEKELEKEIGTEEKEKFKTIIQRNNFEGKIKNISKAFNKLYLDFINNIKLKMSMEGKLQEYLNCNVKNKNNLNKEKYILNNGFSIFEFDTESFDTINIIVNQKLYNSFSIESDFYNFIFIHIKESFRILKNYKMFSIKVENIYNSSGKNIKWDLYSKLSIYSEKLLKVQLKSNFYNPASIAVESLKKFDIVLSNNEIETIASFYKDEINEDEIIKNIPRLSLLESGFFSQYKFMNMGYVFTDLFVLENNNLKLKDDLEYIKNNNELLITFYKYRFDQRKIPCPDCGGLMVSGNSYPEIAHRSWECKNIICPSRSKSNRGKRYSEKTNFMQWGYEENKDIIDKKLIAKWRKDIVSINNDSEILEMIIKYYTFSEENILFINSAEILENEFNRNISYLDIFEKDNIKYFKSENIIEFNINYFIDFFKSYFIKNFIHKKNNITNFPLIVNLENQYQIFNDDSFKILSNLNENSIDTMVTSPPYFNAREYSQWDNLYLYLFDMYNIARMAFKSIKENGIFLYNIGDINSNEKINTKSLMGEKRIPLGAYSIFIFEKAGFELVENIIWDKGETQSNRHKNDGKFTPHYQRPINSYEHMFIFKKPSHNKLKVKKTKWDKNIVKFSPVIKINSKGENKLGHTAPYPLDIPDFVCKAFNKKGNIILDPFLGSGTTIISAMNNNIFGIGIELSKEYAILAENRIKVNI